MWVCTCVCTIFSQLVMEVVLKEESWLRLNNPSPDHCTTKLTLLKINIQRCHVWLVTSLWYMNQYIVKFDVFTLRIRAHNETASSVIKRQPHLLITVIENKFAFRYFRMPNDHIDEYSDLRVVWFISFTILRKAQRYFIVKCLIWRFCVHFNTLDIYYRARCLENWGNL